jgi:hypothetical protein
MVDDDPQVITLRRSTVVRMGIGVFAVAAIGLVVALGVSLDSSPTARVSAPIHHKDKASSGLTVSTTTAPTTSTSSAPAVSTNTGPFVTTPAEEPSIPPSGPTLASCTASVAGWYYPAGRTVFGGYSQPGWDAGGTVAMTTNLANACESQQVLSEAMTNVAGTPVPSSDVIQVYQGVCDNYSVESAPLCMSG